jgi:hypothetical protein
MAPEPVRDATKIRRKEIDLKPNNKKFRINSDRRDLGRSGSTQTTAAGRDVPATGEAKYSE